MDSRRADAESLLGPALSQMIRRCCDDARVLVPECRPSAARLCFLQSCLHACNKALWSLGLQIREDRRDELGEVSVVVVRKLGSGYFFSCLQGHAGLAALALLRILLLEHRCVVAVQMFDVLAGTEVLLPCLAAMRTLKRLTIVVDPLERRYDPGRLVDMVQSLDVNVRVDLRFIEVLHYPYVGTSLLLSLLAQQEAKIAALDLTGLVVDATEAGMLIYALRNNNSVTELAVGSPIFAPGLEDRCSGHFATYLLEKKRTLRKLSLDACDMNIESCRWTLVPNLVAVISAMTSLEELTVDWLCRALDFELFGWLVVHNQSLLSLHVRCRRCCDGWVPHRPDFRPVAQGIVNLWVSGLRANQTLQRLTVDLSLCTVEQCCWLIFAIAVNVSIKTVTLRNIPDNGGLRLIYDVIRICSVEHRVVVEDHHVDQTDAKELRSVPEARLVTLSSPHFPDVPSLCAAFCDLAACGHVTSLRLRFERYDEALYGAAADYIAAAFTLNDIELYAGDFFEADDDSRLRGQHRLIEALASNRNVTKLKLHVAHLNDTCCQLVADSVLHSRILFELSLEALDSSSCATFLRRLLPGLALNYSLLVAALPEFGHLDAEMAALNGLISRNWVVMDRASRFVMGDRDPYFKGPLSLVSDHPKLPERVAEKAGVTHLEAMTMVQETLPLCRCDKHECVKPAEGHSVECCCGMEACAV